MDRYEFLQIAKDFDDNYFINEKEDNFIRKNIQEEAFRNNQTIKEYLSSDYTIPLQYYSQIDYPKIKQLTLLSKDSNPFYELYGYKPESLELFFRILNETDLLLKYYDIYEIDRLRTYNEREELSKKYTAVINDLKAIKSNTNIIERLEVRKQNLTNKTFINLTERRIFESFLSKMHNVYLLQTDQEPGITRGKVVTLVNNIIDKYFGYKISKFSRKIDLLKLESFHYTFETRKEIIVHHRMS